MLPPAGWVDSPISKVERWNNNLTSLVVETASYTLDPFIEEAVKDFAADHIVYFTRCEAPIVGNRRCSHGERRGCRLRTCRKPLPIRRSRGGCCPPWGLDA
jgi:hypothetical protein